MAAVLPGEWLLSCGIIHGHTLSGAPAWVYPWALMCQHLPAAAQTYPGPPSLQRYSCCCTVTARATAASTSACSHMDPSVGQLPVTEALPAVPAQASSTDTQRGPGQLPAQHIPTAVITVFPGTAQRGDKAAQQQPEQKPATNEHWTLMYSQASKAPDKHLPINS